MGEAAFEAIRPHVEKVLKGEPVEFEAEVPYRRTGLHLIASEPPSSSPWGGTRR